MFISVCFLAFLFLQWCRSGVCAIKTAIIEPYAIITRQSLIGKTPEKSNLIDDRKYGNLMKQEYNFNRVRRHFHSIQACGNYILFGVYINISFRHPYGVNGANPVNVNQDAYLVNLADCEKVAPA